jgi:hypothetical protein
VAVVAYYALRPERSNTPRRVRGSGAELADIRFPVVLLTRLGVDLRYHGQGLVARAAGS